MKSAKSKGERPDRTRTQKRRRSVFGSLNHGDDTKGLAMAVHSMPMVVVVPATSDRESIPFGRGFTLKDPQAAGEQCRGSGEVVFIDSPAGEGHFGGDFRSRVNRDEVTLPRCRRGMFGWSSMGECFQGLVRLGSSNHYSPEDPNSLVGTHHSLEGSLILVFSHGRVAGC